jgi:hypothetical protein
VRRSGPELILKGWRKLFDFNFITIEKVIWPIERGLYSRENGLKLREKWPNVLKMIGNQGKMLIGTKRSCRSEQKVRQFPKKF